MISRRTTMLLATGIVTCGLFLVSQEPKAYAVEIKPVELKPILTSPRNLDKGDTLPKTMINDDVVLMAYKQKVKTNEILDLSSGWQAPVEGLLTSTFGPRTNPVTGNFEPAHGALDLAAPSNTPIHASKGGRIISAGWLGGYGNQVVISHGNGYYTRYGHMNKILVETGDTVEQAETIGLMGSTGWSTGPHVHFEIMHGGTDHCYRVDPQKYLKFENNKSVYWSILKQPS